MDRIELVELIALALARPIFSVSTFRLTTRVREPWLTATTPIRRERLDRAAHSLTADREQRGKVPLARQFLADLKDARRDERRELVADPFAHRAPADVSSEMRT